MSQNSSMHGAIVVHPIHGEGEVRQVSPSGAFLIVWYPNKTEGRRQYGAGHPGYYRTHMFDSVEKASL